MDKKLKLKTELLKKLKQETSGTGTGAFVTPGDGEGVAPKYAFGKTNKSKPSGWKDAPSVPNRKSKAMDYKELWEGELKLGVKYNYKGESGFISTGGSQDPKDWKFLGDKQKYPYLTVKADLVPSEKQPEKYDGAFDLGMGKGHHIDEMDANDPVLMAMRAKKDAPAPQISKPNRVQDTIKSTISMLLKKRAEIERDMEQEAEPEGGPIADKYGDMLNKIDKVVAKLKGQGEWGPETDPYMDKGEIERRAAMMEESSDEIHEAGTDEVVVTLNNPNLDPDVKKTLMSAYRQGHITADGVLAIVNLVLNKGSLKEGFKSGKEFINIKLQKYPKALSKVNNLINMIGENNFTMDMAEWIFDFFNNASFESPVNEESLLEGYAQFRNETKMRSKPDQFHQAVKSVKKKMSEINRLFEYMDRLKTELSEGEELKHKKYTESALQQIKENAKALFFKSTKLK